MVKTWRVKITYQDACYLSGVVIKLSTGSETTGHMTWAKMLFYLIIFVKKNPPNI